MQGYSMNGYLNAVLRRSAKTLMVEGVTDYSLMTRLKGVKAAEIGCEPSGIIDVANIIKDDSISGLGKKDIVLKVISEMEGLDGARKDSLKKKFGVLHDREWDGLDLELQLNSPWHPPLQSDNYFITVGHSVENYFFREEAIEAYLRQYFSDFLNQDFFNSLRQRFNSILGLAAVYSLAIRHISSITKSMGLINYLMIVREGDKYFVGEGLSPALSGRNVIVPENFVELINLNIVSYLDKYHFPEPARWLCHGHLGEDAIWACLANLSREFNVSNEVANKIERGHKDSRFKHAVDFLSRETLANSGPLEPAINWLTAA